MSAGSLLAGRFELIELAGSGGMGTVWLARDVRDGTRVAVKRIHPSRSGRIRFLREGRILASLQHPGIVRYVDHGTEADGGLYLVMEWLSGEDLAHALARGRAPRPKDVVELGLKVARALGAAHRAGIVHRDVKPANVFLVEGRFDRPKLLDFGVALVADTEPGAAHIGTVGYMAPEQVGGADVAPPADVFGLGCLIYECIAGQPAFSGATAVAVLAKVLLEDPVSLRQLSPEVPVALEDLVVSMLAKEPEDRPQDGAAAAAALSLVLDSLDPARARTSDSMRGAITASVLPARREPPSREPAWRWGAPDATPFVGRRGELGMLGAIADAVFDDHEAAAAVVTGEAGVGKTRLVKECLRRLGAPGDDYSLWICRGDPTGTSSPWSLAADGLRRHLALRGGETPEYAGAVLEERVSSVVRGPDARRVAAFLGELIGVSGAGPASARVQNARRDAAELRREIHEAVIDIGRAACRDRPLVIVLDDLQWADQSSFALFGALLERLSDRPVLLLATADPSLDLRFPALWGAAQVQRVVLRALSERPSRELARALVPSASSAQLDAIVERANGNPFLLDGLARVATEGEDLPIGVRATVEQRIAKLEPDAQEVLMAASAFGGAFWVSGLRRLVGGRVAEELDAWLGILEDAGLVRSHAGSRYDNERELELDHRLMREVAYDLLTDDSRASAHGLIADWLEEVREPKAAVVAQHAERAGQPARAAALWLRAAEQALDAHDGPTCLELVKRAEQLSGGDLDLGKARLLEAAASAWVGDAVRSEEKAREAMTLLPERSPAWYDASKHLLIAAYRIGRHEELVPIARKLVPGLHDPDPRPAALAVVTWSMTFMLGGQAELAGELLDRLDELGDIAKEPRLAGRASAVRAFAAHRERDMDAYVRWAEMTVRMLTREGEERSACLRLNNLGVALRQAGRLDEARDVLETALATAERLGARAQAATNRHNAAVVALEQGSIERAIEMDTRAIAELASSGARRIEGLARTELARALLSHGELEAAEHQGRAAVSVLADVPVSRAYAEAMLARTLLAQDRLAEADVAASEARRLLRELEWIPEGDAWVRLTRAEVWWALGRCDDARAEIFTLRDLLLATAQRIAEPEHQKVYLRSIEAHRRALELAERWSRR